MIDNSKARKSRMYRDRHVLAYLDQRNGSEIQSVAASDGAGQDESMSIICKMNLSFTVVIHTSVLALVLTFPSHCICA